MFASPCASRDQIQNEHNFKTRKTDFPGRNHALQKSSVTEDPIPQSVISIRIVTVGTSRHFNHRHFVPASQKLIAATTLS